MNATLLGIALLIGRGEMIAQGELPYIDALPLDHADRNKIIEHYRGRANKECEKQGCEDYWDYRAATRLYLRDLELMWEAPYMLGRLQGRHHLWGWFPDKDGNWYRCWGDAMR